MVDKGPEIYPLQFKENGMKRVEGKVAEKGIGSRWGREGGFNNEFE